MNQLARHLRRYAFSNTRRYIYERKLFQHENKPPFIISNCVRRCLSSNVDDNSNLLRDKQRRKDTQTGEESKLLLLKNDPDVFGTLTPGKQYNSDEEEEDLGDIAEREYLENIPKKSQQLSTKQYATKIKDHFKNHRLKEAIDVLEVQMLKVDRVKPENYIYNLLISECGRLGFAKKAFQLFTRMKQRGLKVTGATYTALFNSCANSPFLYDGLTRARRLREIMLEKGYEPNETNYHAMIKAFGRTGDLQTAFELVDEMKTKKLKLEVSTFNFLLQAAASDSEFGFRHALLVWHKIYRHGMNPDIYSFNTMLRCVRDCGMGDMETTQQVIGDILFSSKKGAAPKKNTLVRETGEAGEVILIGSDKNAAEAEDGSSSVPSTESVSVPDTDVAHDQTPNLLSKTPHLGSLVALSEINKAEDRLLLLGGMGGFMEQLKTSDVLPDIKTFTQLLDVIPSTYAAEKRLLTYMKEVGVRTDVDFFNILMKKRSLRMDYEGARKVLDMIDAARLEPDIATYGVLALGCKTKEEGQDYIRELRDKGIKVNIYILGALLKNGCHANCYEYIADVLYLLIDYKIKPSKEFLEIIETHHQKLLKKFLRNKSLPKHDVNDFFRFSREFQRWKKRTGLDGLNHEEAVKIVQEHPWGQFKQSQPKGVEHVKNSKKMHLKKKGHVLHKFNESKLDDEGGFRVAKNQFAEKRDDEVERKHPWDQ